MESIFKKIDKLGTKISDKLNQGKWDNSCVNYALLGMSEDKPKGKPKEEYPVDKPQQSSENIIVSKTEVIKPEVKPTVEVSSKVIEEKPIVSESDKEEDKLSSCYYVLIKHIKTYIGEISLIRCCDYERVWSNDMPVDMPKYDYCPKCGRHTIYTETEMD